MNVIEEVKNTQGRERRSDSPQDVSDARIRQLGEAAASIPDDRRRERAMSMLHDWLDQRQAKILKLASFASRGANVETSSMTETERETFERLQEELARHRDRLLADVEQDTDTTRLDGVEGGEASGD